MNIRSLPSHISDLKNLLSILKSSKHDIDIIMLCETYLTDLNCHCYPIEGYTFVDKHRTESKQGGVALYISEKLRFNLRDDISIYDEQCFESVFVEIECNNGKNLIAGEVYRRPNSSMIDLENFFKHYETVTSTVNLESKHLILGTDQNLDYLKINTHSKTSEFLDMNLSSGLLPVITKPTRICQQASTLIDNIYVNSNCTHRSQSGILLYDISDHLPCFVFLDQQCKRNLWKY